MEKSINESKILGLNIHRTIVENLDVNLIKKYIYDNNVDIFILRINSIIKNEHSQLLRIEFPIIHCDTLVSYECNLEEHNPNQIKNNILFVEINQDTEYKLNELVSKIFNNYKNHYLSNFILDKDKILNIYIEWAKDFVKSKSNNKISWYLVENNEIIGFATCSFNELAKECEGILYGIVPEKSGGGLYSDMIRFTQKYFKELGYKKMKVSTQIQNFAVQRVWNREGFILKNSYDTYHINSFLDFGNIKYDTELIFNNEDIDNFGVVSGDKNPLHFDDEYAKRFGFKGRILHGIGYEMKLTKILGNEWPGYGTIILTNKVIFNKPIYPFEKYRLLIKSIYELENGYSELVALLKSQDLETINIAYIKVLKR